LAQGGRDSLTMAMLVPQQAIKFSPMHLVNFYPTIEFSFEQKVATRTTLQIEAGYVLDYNNDWNEEFLDKRGVKGKLEGRYYFFGRTDKRKIYYLAGEVYGNFINFDRVSSREECFDVNCEHAFIRTVAYKMEYREHGFSFKIGLIKYVGKFFFDFNSGWTIRDIEYREPVNFSGGFTEDWTLWEIPNEDDRVTFSPNVGIRFGYRLR
jgi:hypothetical protein